MICIFCRYNCRGKCDEWKKMQKIVNELERYFENDDENIHLCHFMKKKEKDNTLIVKKNRVYKKRHELMETNRISRKCIECRIDRKVCVSYSNTEKCIRCINSTDKTCIYDSRL